MAQARRTSGAQAQGASPAQAQGASPRRKPRSEPNELWNQLTFVEPANILHHHDQSLCGPEPNICFHSSNVQFGTWDYRSIQIRLLPYWFILLIYLYTYIYTMTIYMYSNHVIVTICICTIYHLLILLLFDISIHGPLKASSSEEGSVQRTRFAL